MKKIISLILILMLIFTFGFSMISCDEEEVNNENPGGSEIPDWSDLGGEDDIVLPPIPIAPID